MGKSLEISDFVILHVDDDGDDVLFLMVVTSGQILSLGHFTIIALFKTYNCGFSFCFEFPGYNCMNFSGDISNVFATVAFRFGHSQITEDIMLKASMGKGRKMIPYQSVSTC